MGAISNLVSLSLLWQLLPCQRRFIPAPPSHSRRKEELSVCLTIWRWLIILEEVEKGLLTLLLCWCPSAPEILPFRHLFSRPRTTLLESGTRFDYLLLMERSLCVTSDKLTKILIQGLDVDISCSTFPSKWVSVKIFCVVRKTLLSLELLHVNRIRN